MRNKNLSQGEGEAIKILKYAWHDAALISANIRMNSIFLALRLLPLQGTWQRKKKKR